ncbi:MAG: phosphotransferase [bacterium]|nr:phosphotransferase [bacterium]
MPSIPDIPPAALAPLIRECIHSARSVAQADLYAMEWKGRPALLKTFAARPWLVRRLWSRAVAGRELRVLRRLQGMAGIPRLYATAGPEAFIMERLDAARMPRRHEPPPPPEFWTNARRLLDELHARGIGHGDLRRKNILMGPSGEAWFIDFATAWTSDAGRPLAGFFFRRCRRIDRVTYARIKATYAPESLDADERAWLAAEPWYLRWGRVLKRRVYRLRKGRFWRKKIRRTRRTLHRRLGPPR